VWEPSLTGRRTERAFLQGGGKSRLLPLSMRPKLLFYISRGGCKIIKTEIIQSSVKKVQFGGDDFHCARCGDGSAAHPVLTAVDPNRYHPEGHGVTSWADFVAAFFYRNKPRKSTCFLTIFLPKNKSRKPIQNTQVVSVAAVFCPAASHPIPFTTFNRQIFTIYPLVLNSGANNLNVTKLIL
jgi:hypothetical protein